MENSHCFFENKKCEYYPCHKGLKELNCLFCYCPLYTKEKCPGNPVYFMADDKKVKDCSKCIFPHIPENYDKVIMLLQNE